MEAIFFLPLIGAAVGYLGTGAVVSTAVGLTAIGPTAGSLFTVA